MVGMPVFVGQHFNALRMVRRGFGIKLDVADFTPECLRSAIKEMLTYSSYRDNIRKASEIFRHRPMTTGKGAAWWIYHEIKYDGDHLYSEAIHLPLYQYLLIDVFLGLCIVVLLFLFICFKCFKILRCVIHCNKQMRD